MENRLLIVRMPDSATNEEFELMQQALEALNMHYDFVILRDNNIDRPEFEYPKNAEYSVNELSAIKEQCNRSLNFSA